MTTDNKIGISFLGAGNIGSTVIKRLVEMSNDRGGSLGEEFRSDMSWCVI